MFPDDFPKDCPPREAQSAEGMVYRLVKSDPPGESDFRSHHETGKIPKADPCLRRGLSVFGNVSDAIHQRALYPRLGAWIAEGLLSERDGVTMPTAGRMPSHTTWWPFIGVIRSHSFRVIKEYKDVDDHRSKG